MKCLHGVKLQIESGQVGSGLVGSGQMGGNLTDMVVAHTLHLTISLAIFLSHSCWFLQIDRKHPFRHPSVLLLQSPAMASGGSALSTVPNMKGDQTRGCKANK